MRERGAILRTMWRGNAVASTLYIDEQFTALLQCGVIELSHWMSRLAAGSAE